MISDVYYDRDGNPIESGVEWGKYHVDPEYKRVASSYVAGKHISTVWVGMNMAFRNGPPIIFETMVFSEDADDGFMQRYATEEEALLGHLEVLRRLKVGESLMEEGPDV